MSEQSMMFLTGMLYGAFIAVGVLYVVSGKLKRFLNRKPKQYIFELRDMTTGEEYSVSVISTNLKYATDEYLERFNDHHKFDITNIKIKELTYDK